MGTDKSCVLAASPICACGFSALNLALLVQVGQDETLGNFPHSSKFTAMNLPYFDFILSCDDVWIQNIKNIAPNASVHLSLIHI